MGLTTVRISDGDGRHPTKLLFDSIEKKEYDRMMMVINYRDDDAINKIDPMVTKDSLLASEIKNELCRMAVDSSLPSDMTEHDMDGIIEKVKTQKRYKMEESFEKWMSITSYDDWLLAAIHFHHLMNNGDNDIASMHYNMQADHENWPTEMIHEFIT